MQPLISDGGAKSIITDGPAGPALTPYWHDLRAQLEALPDLKLVVLDPLSLFVGGDTNDNTLGAAFMAELNSLAAKTGAVVMVVHHFAKNGKITGLGDARNAIRGASAYVDNGRWALVLWEADEDTAYDALKAIGDTNPQRAARQSGIVYFGGLAKSNAPTVKEQRLFVRGPVGLLEDRTNQIRAARPSTPDVDALIYAGLLARKQSQSRFTFTASATALWNTMGPTIKEHSLPVTKDGKRRGSESVETVFNRLRAAGRIRETERPGCFEPN